MMFKILVFSLLFHLFSCYFVTIFHDVVRMNFLTGAQIYGDMILFPNSFYFLIGILSVFVT